MLWTFRDLAGTMTFTPSEVADQAEIPLASAQAFFGRFSVEFNTDESDVLRAMDYVRDRPLIACGDGRYQLIIPGEELWALRPALESALVDGGDATQLRYSRHRSKTLEDRVAGLLHRTLKPDELHRGLRYRRFDDSEEAREGEIDVLVRLDDTLLVVEAKSATMPISGRRGGEALVQHLKKHLAKAAVQSSNARDAVLDRERVELLDHRGRSVQLKADRVREVHPIVVTLDDVSVIGPALWEFEGTRIMPEGIALPWLVSWHDLNTIALLVDLPSQVIHFLRRRSRLNQLGGRWAADELDWWMLYLHNSLYFEDEDGAPVRYTSMTDPLDAWAFGERGLRSPAPRPQQEFGQGVGELLLFLEQHRPPGGIAAACSILDLATSAREGLMRDLRNLRARAATRDKVQRLSRWLVEPYELMFCIVAVPADERLRLPLYLRSYVAERLTAEPLGRVLAIGVSAGSAEPLEALLVIEPGVWELPARPESDVTPNAPDEEA
jgi:hypothetical protein